MRATKIAVLAVLLLLLPALLFAGGQKAREAKELEIFSWWTAGGEAEGLNEMFKLYSAKYPDVKIINATVAGGAGMNAKAVLATRMQGGDPPDSFQVHAGHELIDSWVVAGYLSAYPPGVIDIISYQNEVYSAPVNIHRSNVLWYNKQIFKNQGLTAPKTIDEFTAAAKKLSGAGITPLALGDNGIWASVHLFESVLLAALGPEKYVGLWNGSETWDSAGTKRAINLFVGLLAYVNSDHAALSWDNAAQYVADGKAAMTIMGDWAEGYFKAKGLTPDKEFGWAPTPGTGGSFIMLSDSFGLPKGAPHRAEAVNWVALCASKEGQDAFNPKKGSIPSRTDGDKSLYDAYLRSAMDDFSSNKIVPSVAHGAAAAEGWVTDISDVMTLLVTDKNVNAAVTGFVRAAGKALK
jgi:glucose/mannose transport system substrate-binding protein